MSQEHACRRAGSGSPAPVSARVCFRLPDAGEVEARWKPPPHPALSLPHLCLAAASIIEVSFARASVGREGSASA